jgi:YesN/AraC family two-component response regulator
MNSLNKKSPEVFALVNTSITSMAIDKNTYKILVIEDNPGDFALVEDFLFEQIETPAVFLAHSYKSAQRFLNNNKYDIILLDISLPDKTGEPLIRDIIELSANTPVIVLTGYVDFSFGVKSMSLGVADYILKDDLTSMSLYKSIVYAIERKKSIIATEKQNATLREISWIQSHIVRAPLARILGLVALLKDVKEDSPDKHDILAYLEKSAGDLDDVIKDITDKVAIQEDCAC